MSPCQVNRKALYEWSLGGGREGPLTEHVAECAICQASLAQLKTGLDALKASEPAPLEPFAAARFVARALDSIDEDAPRRSFRRSLWWGAGLATLAVTFTLLALFLMPGPTLPSGETTLVSGAIVAEEDGRPRGGTLPAEIGLVTGPSATTVRLDDDSRIVLSPGTRFRLRRKGTLLELLEGTVKLSVKPRAGRPLDVVTDEARVRVVGTQFIVERLAGAHPRTNVSVEEGRVEVTGPEGVVMLQPGQSKSLGAAPSEPVPEPQKPLKPARPLKVPPRRVPTASMARDRLNAGDYRGVHLMAKEVRDLGEQAALEAELTMLEAEAYLAEAQPGNALDSYLTVVHQFPSHPLGEQALFAAAQLALDYRPAQTQRLIDEYLRRYPAGRYRKDVEGLLGGK